MPKNLCSCVVSSGQGTSMMAWTCDELQAAGRHHVAEKLQAGGSELALVNVQQKAALTQPLQNQAEMLEVCLLVRTGDEDIV